MDTRPPPSGAPPPYVRVVNRVYRRSLRPIIVFVAGISLIWGVVLGVRFIRARSDSFSTSRMRTFDLVLAILYFIVAGIEGIGIAAGILQRIFLARLYFLLSTIGAFLVFGLEIFRLIVHFTTKSDEINSCTQDLDGDTVQVIGGGGATAVTPQQAQDLCNDAWQRGTWYDVAWLIASTILAFLFASLAAAYYHQLLDPSFSRTTQPPSNAFRMGPWHQQQQPYHQDLPFIPPYPGAPTVPYNQDQPPQYSGGDDDFKPEKEKGDGVSRGLHGASDSTVTLQPVSLHDDPTPSDGRQNVEGRV